MSDLDTETKMARLQMAFPSNDALADQLGIERTTVARVANGSAPGERHPDVVDAVDDLHEKIQNEHTAALSMDATFQQAIVELRAAETMGEVEKIVDRTERGLDKQRDRICD